MTQATEVRVAGGCEDMVPGTLVESTPAEPGEQQRQ